MRKKIETPQAGEMYVFRHIEDGREEWCYFVLPTQHGCK